MRRGIGSRQKCAQGRTVAGRWQRPPPTADPRAIDDAHPGNEPAGVDKGPCQFSDLGQQPRRELSTVHAVILAKRCWPPGPGRVAKGSLALDVVVAARVGFTDFMAQQGVATQRRERCEGERDLQPSDAAATGVLAAECSAPGSMPLLYEYRLSVEGRVLGVLELSSSEVLEATVQTPVAGQEGTARNLPSRPATRRLISVRLIASE